MMKIKMRTFPFRIKEIIENIRKNINNATNNKQMISFLSFVASVESFLNKNKFVTKKQKKGLKNIANFLSYTPAEREIIEENYYDLKTI